MNPEKLKFVVGTALKQESMNNSGLKLLGIGAEKMVFETVGSERKIIKVNTLDVLDKIMQKLGLDSLKDTNEIQLKSVKERHETEDAIAEVFGREHILKSGVFKAKIPMSKDVLIVISRYLDLPSEIHEEILGFDEGFIFEIETIAETQTKAKEITEVEKYKTVDLCAPLMTHDEFKETEGISEALNNLRQFIDERFLAEFEKKYSNEKYREKVKEIIIKIIAYAKKTGEMLDIFGPNNITIFTNENGEVDYHLLDVVLPGKRIAWLVKYSDDPKLDSLRHFYTYFYFISELAKKLGIHENLDPEDLIYFKGVGIPQGGKFIDYED